jgi:hypothetical protein
MVTVLEMAEWDTEADGLDTTAKVMADGVNASAATTEEEVS